MEYNIAVVKGDGIGPEIVSEAMLVLDKVGEKFGHKFNFQEVLAGGCSIDKNGIPLTDETIEICKDKDFKGLCFVNLVDFDALWGHRRNPVGYGEELERFDAKLGELLENLREDDLLMITADHGNDPTYTGTDHTREKVPFIAYSPSMKEKGMFEEQKTFGVIGATVLDNFGLKKAENMIGESILKELE